MTLRNSLNNGIKFINLLFIKLSVKKNFIKKENTLRTLYKFEKKTNT